MWGCSSLESPSEVEEGWHTECCWALAEEEEQRKFIKSRVKRKRREAGSLEQRAGSSDLSQDNYDIIICASLLTFDRRKTTEKTNLFVCIFLDDFCHLFEFYTC